MLNHIVLSTFDKIMIAALNLTCIKKTRCYMNVKSLLLSEITTCTTWETKADHSLEDCLVGG